MHHFKKEYFSIICFENLLLCSSLTVASISLIKHRSLVVSMYLALQLPICTETGRKSEAFKMAQSWDFVCF